MWIIPFPKKIFVLDRERDQRIYRTLLMVAINFMFDKLIRRKPKAFGHGGLSFSLDGD